MVRNYLFWFFYIYNYLYKHTPGIVNKFFLTWTMAMFNDKGLKKLDLNSLAKKDEQEASYAKGRSLVEKNNSNMEFNEKEVKFV